MALLKVESVESAVLSLRKFIEHHFLNRTEVVPLLRSQNRIVSETLFCVEDNPTLIDQQWMVMRSLLMKVMGQAKTYPLF